MNLQSERIAQACDQLDLHATPSVQRQLSWLVRDNYDGRLIVVS